MSVNVSTNGNAQSASLDLSAPDSFSSPDKAVANYDAIYDSALKSIQQMLQQLFAQEGPIDAGGADSSDQSGSGMTAQSASGALASYMHENGINTLDPNQLYQMAYNPKSGTPSAVSDAAKFMLENPDTFNQIETHDVAGADGIAGVNDFDWAAQGGLSSASNEDDTQSMDDPMDLDPTDDSGAPMDAQSASGAMSACMRDQGNWTVDPNKLYQMAYNPSAGTTPEDSAAAKFMLSHPDTYNQIETHDVAGADGIAGVNDFDWAAQGGLDQNA
ncbi:hypothetical protein [Trinickia dinghuensis]|uniref:Uncharacterized protein n=1 Tax=Trinickia dinghuensis TaxID=2291023 RepID=A0A3D8K794_9BURK|nr:hypothetical protein [Trinickia dinghuensis]RDV00452.1 hypothetical protein DWV00_01280 [Trinickia dinghuensis]